MPDDAPASNSSQPSRLPRAGDPVGYLWGVMGLGLIAYGGYQIYLAQHVTAFGSFIILCGITLMPWAYISIIGGVGLLGWAGWWTFAVAKYPMDYLYTLLAVVFGLTAIIERVRVIRRR